MKMKSATRSRWALLDSGMKKHMPAANRVHAICGKANSRRDRLPNVAIVQIAMVQIAGQVKRKLTRPNPHDARSAPVVEAPALTKTVEL